MGRRKYEANDETAYRWCERYRRGDSFRKIGLDEGVDRRLVARVVRDFNRLNHLEEGVATRRQVRADLLREHLQALEIVAWFLPQLTVAPSILRKYCTYSPDIEEELRKMVKDKMPSQKPPFLSLAPLNPDQYEHAQEKEAKIIVGDLKEHLPNQWKQVEQWQSAATQYGEKLEQLAKQADDKGIDASLFESGLRECLDSISKFQEEDNLPPILVKPKSAAEVALWLFKNSGTRELLKPFHDNLEALEKEYTKLEDMLNPSDVRKALLERECRHCPLPLGQTSERKIKETKERRQQ